MKSFTFHDDSFLVVQCVHKKTKFKTPSSEFTVVVHPPSKRRVAEGVVCRLAHDRKMQ